MNVAYKFCVKLIKLLLSQQIFVLDQFLKAHLPLEGEENVHKGEFIVTGGDFIPVAPDPAGLNFVQTEKARFYQLKLDQIFRSSPLSESYMFNEVLWLEALGPRGVRVHFNVHLGDKNVTSGQIYRVLAEQIRLKDPSKSYLAEIQIESESLNVQGKTLRSRI